MSLVFLCLKAFKIWETPYDFAVGMVLVDLDLMVLAEWYRIFLHRRGR